MSAANDIIMTAGNNMKINVGKKGDGSSSSYSNNYKNSLLISVTDQTALKTDSRWVEINTFDDLKADERHADINTNDTTIAGDNIALRAGKAFEAGVPISRGGDDYNSALIVQNSGVTLANNLGDVTIDSQTNVSVSGNLGIDVNSTGTVTVKGFQIKLN